MSGESLSLGLFCLAAGFVLGWSWRGRSARRRGLGDEIARWRKVADFSRKNISSQAYVKIIDD